MSRRALEVVDAENTARLAQEFEAAQRSGIPMLAPFEYLDEPSDMAVSALCYAGGGGTSGGMSDDWKISVDRQLSQLHGDVRALLNRGVIAVVGLAAMIAGLYLYANTKFDAVNQTLTTIEVQHAKSDAKLDLLIQRTGPDKSSHRP